MIASHSDQGELRAWIAEEVGTDPERYLNPSGKKGGTPLLASEVSAICEQLDIDAGETKRSQLDALLEELDRDHRTGVHILDSADLFAVIEAIKEENDD